MRPLLFIMFGIIVLSFTAEKCRQLVGEESSSRTWTDRFTFMNCFDMSYGTIACITKELLKLYLYYIRALHVDNIRTETTKTAITEALSQGQTFEHAINTARQKGDAVARQASREMKHVIGPVLSSGWDIFETIYVGGSISEGIVRGTGTLVGAYVGGIIGDGKLRWVGFLVGSQLGSWVGSRLGLIVYDVGNGVQYLLQLVHRETKSYHVSPHKDM